MKIKAGILGCTGAVGQKFITLLQNHPIFEISELAASEKSAGKKYIDAVNWTESSPIPDKIKNKIVKKCIPDLNCKIVFSGLDSSVAGEIEDNFANAGYYVISNSRNHRMDEDVPLLIPELNPGHISLLIKQLKRRNSGGFIVTNPNCSTVVLCLSILPFLKSNKIEKILVSTMQAISGAGYPGVPSLDILGNVIPHIKDEEEKIQSEPLKIFGEYKNNKIIFSNIKISSMCNRVPVIDGHTLSVSVKLKNKTSIEKIISNIDSIKTEKLNSSPEKLIYYFSNPSRPQPSRDVNLGNGMSISIGNLRKCNILDYKYTALGHNTIRGAAGLAIMNAEFLLKKGLIKK